jgi:hypothetical protein
MMDTDTLMALAVIIREVAPIIIAWLQQRGQRRRWRG